MREYAQSAVVILLLTGGLEAQDPFLDQWRTDSAAQPPQVKLEVSSSKTTYNQGEAIPLKLDFSSFAPNAFYADRQLTDFGERLNGVELFIVDPAESADDPLEKYFSVPRPRGGSVFTGGPPLLTSAPFTIERVLNDWIRFEKPGVYRV